MTDIRADRTETVEAGRAPFDRTFAMALFSAGNGVMSTPSVFAQCVQIATEPSTGCLPVPSA